MYDGKLIFDNERQSGEFETMMKELVVAADGDWSRIQTRTCPQESKIDMNLVTMDKIFTLPLVESSLILGHSFANSGGGIASLNSQTRKRNESPVQGSAHPQKQTASIKQKCLRIVSHMYSIVSFGCDNWSCSRSMDN